MAIDYDPTAYEMPWRRNYELMSAGVWLTGATGYGIYAALGSFPAGPLLWIAGGMSAFGLLKLRKGLRLMRLQHHLAGTPLPVCTFDELQSICTDPAHRGEIWLGKGFLWGPTHTQRVMDILRRDWQQIVRQALGPFYVWRFVKKHRKLALTHPLQTRHIYFERQKSLQDKGQPWIHGVGGGEDDLFQPISHTEGHTLVIGTTGAGKAQPVTAKILTPTGWKKLGEVVPGDQAISWRGEPARVEAVYERGEREAWAVCTGDGRRTEACEEHLWTVWLTAPSYLNAFVSGGRKLKFSRLLDPDDRYAFAAHLRKCGVPDDADAAFSGKPVVVTTKLMRHMLLHGWQVEIPAYTPSLRRPHAGLGDLSAQDRCRYEDDRQSHFSRNALIAGARWLAQVDPSWETNDKYFKASGNDALDEFFSTLDRLVPCVGFPEERDTSSISSTQPLTRERTCFECAGSSRAGGSIGIAGWEERLRRLPAGDMAALTRELVYLSCALWSVRQPTCADNPDVRIGSKACGRYLKLQLSLRPNAALAVQYVMRRSGLTAVLDPLSDGLWIHLDEEAFAVGLEFPDRTQELVRRSSVRSVGDINRRVRVVTVVPTGLKKRMRCIKLANPEENDELYVTDDCIVTHNTRCFDLLISQAILRGECVIIIDPKGDADLKNKAQRACAALGRKNAFVMFHPAKTEESAHINLLANWTRPTELASRIANLIQSTGQSDPFKNFSWDALNKVAQGLCIAYEKPSIMNLRRYLESSPEELFEKAFSKHILKSYGEAGERIIDKLYSACKRDTIENRVTALINHYLQHGPNDPALDGLISLRNHDKEHFGKMVTSLLPILSQLTSGKLGRLLSPPEDPDEQGTAIFRDTGDFIEKNAVVYMGLDSLSDNMVGSAIGSLMLADLTAAAGSIYNFKEERRIVNVFVDEAAECVNDSFIQLLNKGRGARFKLVVATQTISDFAARLGSMDKAMQVVGNLNNTISLRCIDEKTQQFVTRRFPKTKVKAIAIDQGLSTDADDPLPKGGRLGERLTEEEVDLFPSELLNMLPDLEFIANLSGGKVVKGRYPFLVQDRSEFKPQ